MRSVKFKKVLILILALSLPFMIIGCGEGDDPTTHTHTACETCGKCTDEACPGADEEKCPGHEAHTHAACETCGKCTDPTCPGADEEKCPGHVTHNHTACETCGKCTDEACPGTDEEKCQGHTVHVHTVCNACGKCTDEACPGADEEKCDKVTGHEINTNLSDELRMDFVFEGKEFIADGVGEVRINRVVDGDTISVYTNGESITIRFLNINTPESTGDIEPWGKAASAYAKEKINSAYSIVLESEGSRRDTNGRYLAFIWYKETASTPYRLFNLEEVELGYGKYTVRTESKYHSYFKEAHDRLRTIGAKAYGEIDPNYNYSKEVVETTLFNLQQNHDDYQTGTKFKATVRLVRTCGNNMYLEDAEEQTLELENGNIISGKGHFYAFYGYTLAYYRNYYIGEVFTLQFQLEWKGTYGTQLTGLANPSNPIASMTETPEILELNADLLISGASLAVYDSQVVKLKNLQFLNYKLKTTASGENYYTAQFKNSSGAIFDVYFGNGLITKWNVPNLFVEGGIYDIVGGVAYYEYAEGQYQLSVGDGPRYNNNVLHKEDIVRVNDVVKTN